MILSAFFIAVKSQHCQTLTGLYHPYVQNLASVEVDLTITFIDKYAQNPMKVVMLRSRKTPETLFSCRISHILVSGNK